MFDFCPHCGQTTDQEQVVGSMLICSYCGQAIGIVDDRKPEDAVAPVSTIDAAKCAICGQLVETRPAGTLAPHYAIGVKKICPGSGKKV